MVTAKEHQQDLSTLAYYAKHYGSWMGWDITNAAEAHAVKRLEASGYLLVDDPNRRATYTGKVNSPVVIRKGA